MIDNKWRRSTRCDNSGPNCVEARTVNGVVQVRNSTNPGTVVEFTVDEWRAFTPVADTDFAV